MIRIFPVCRILLMTSLLLVSVVQSAAAEESTWVFQHGRYSHDHVTGARVAQYAPLPRIRQLADTSSFSSGYHRTRVQIRGTDGSVDTYNRVENYGNNRGGIDAEWERYNDVWQRSVLAGGYSRGYSTGNRYSNSPSYGYGYPSHRGPIVSPYGYGGIGGGYGGHHGYEDAPPPPVE